MRATNLKRSFLFRYILLKQWRHYTEVETNVLIGIHLMNQKSERCSCNTLFKYLSKVHRTPYKKKLLFILRKFKEDGMIRILGKGPGTKIKLTTDAILHLFQLEEKLRGENFPKNRFD